MKTKEQCLSKAIDDFIKTTDRIKWFFNTIEVYELEEGEDFTLFDGNTYTVCICLGIDYHNFDITYAVKNEDPNMNVYIEMQCWSLYLAFEQGQTIESDLA